MFHFVNISKEFAKWDDLICNLVCECLQEQLSHYLNPCGDNVAIQQRELVSLPRGSPKCHSYFCHSASRWSCQFIPKIHKRCCAFVKHFHHRKLKQGAFKRSFSRPKPHGFLEIWHKNPINIMCVKQLALLFWMTKSAFCILLHTGVTWKTMCEPAPSIFIKSYM